jgi:hypothetical protein
VYIALAIVIPEESYQSAHRSPSDPALAQSSQGKTSYEPEDVGASEGSHPNRDLFVGRRRQWAALILVAVGVVLLAGNFGVFRWFNWNVYWPLVLVAIGSWLLVHQSREER